MNTAIIILVVAGATFLGGMAFGFVAGLSKGMSLAALCRVDRPVSPLPWILSFAGAAAMLLLSIGSAIYTIRFLSHSIQTTGTVVDIVEQTDKDGGHSRFPVYEYRTSDGVTHKVKSSMSDGEPYSTGETIPVRYLPTSPQSARIDNFAHHWFLPIFTGIASVFLICLGVGLRWWKSKEQEWANKRLQAIASPGGAAQPEA